MFEGTCPEWWLSSWWLAIAWLFGSNCIFAALQERAGRGSDPQLVGSRRHLRCNWGHAEAVMAEPCLVTVVFLCLHGSCPRGLTCDWNTLLIPQFQKNVFLTDSVCVISSGDAVLQLSCWLLCPLISRKQERCCTGNLGLDLWLLLQSVSGFGADTGTARGQFFFSLSTTCLPSLGQLNSRSKLVVMGARKTV